jgi:hypothetical protein
MEKYSRELFTFLDYDGIPWNNNNAEHAIKYFAKYRRPVNPCVSEIKQPRHKPHNHFPADYK